MNIMDEILPYESCEFNDHILSWVCHKNSTYDDKKMAKHWKNLLLHI